MTAEDAGGYRMSSADFASRYVYPEDAPIVGEQVRLAFEARDPDYFAKIETRILSGAGAIVWVEVRFRVEKDLQGNTIRLIGVNQDITERKQSDQRLRDSEKRFKAIFDQAPIAMALLDKQGHPIISNPPLSKMVGYSHDELSKMTFSEFTCPDDIDKDSNQFTELMEGKISAYSMEKRYVHKNGNLIWANLLVTVLRDDDGRPQDIIGMATDITNRKLAELELQHSEAELAQAQRITRIGSWEWVPATGVISWSEGLNLVLARDIGSPAPTFEDLQHFYTPESWQRLSAAIARTIDTGAPYDLELEMITANGVACWTSTHGEAVRGTDSAIVMLRGTVQDITDRKEAEASIKSLNRVLSVLGGINALIVRVHDSDELFREACQIAVEKGGFRMALVVNLEPGTSKVVSITAAGMDEELLSMIKDRFSSSNGLLTSVVGLAVSGKQPTVSNDSLNDPRLVFGKIYAESGVRSMVTLPLIVSDQVMGTISLYANEMEFFHEEEMQLLMELAGDIAFAIDHIGKRERLNYLAYYDVLTGLANRTLFLERVTQHIRSAVNGGHKLAVFLIDLARFKNINDSLGRPTGDALLKQVAEWLTHNTGDANLLTRIDADHFAIVLPEVKSDANLAMRVANLMAAFLEHSFRLNDAVFRISVKMGIAIFPDDGEDADALFRNAEAALKQAKASGDQFLFYTQKMTQDVVSRLTLENQLRQAIDNEAFVLHYQPKVNFVTGKVTSAEALIRWNDPRTGLVPPGLFIPILEETGMIYEVGRWALRKAVADSLR